MMPMKTLKPCLPEGRQGEWTSGQVVGLPLEQVVGFGLE